MGCYVMHNSFALLYSKNYMSGPVKYEEKSNLSNLLETIHTTSYSGQTMFNSLYDVGMADLKLS